MFFDTIIKSFESLDSLLKEVNEKLLWRTRCPRTSPPTKVKHGKCEYKTETEIPDTSSVTEKQQQLKFHLEFNHPSPAQNVVGSPPPGDTRRKAKLPQPGIDQDQPLEAWETFLTRWAEYKKQMQVSTTNVAGQLISCGSDELQTSLQRIVGRELYNKTEVELLGKMKKLVVKYQNPAVYVEEFLTTK